MEKVIHYCWFGPRPLGKLEKKCIKSWEKYLPDYKEIILSAAKWADENGYKPSFVSEVVFE
jgi:mannosyltransferase OCH1-like enzyme